MAEFTAGGPQLSGAVDPGSAGATASLRAAAILIKHPWVGSVRVGEAGELRVRPASSALAVQPFVGPLISDYLAQWSELYDWVYEQGSGRHTDELDLSGWRASESNRPFSVEHMTDWVERTVELVLRGRPRLVLELGCGTGLLLHRLWREVAGYVGTDVSVVAIERITAAEPPGVVLVEAAAHEARSERVRRALETLGGAHVRPDCVLINSVTQHFPGVRYLEAVVRDAIAMVAPGGTVVIGDVRHAGLLDHYCASIEFAADATAPPAEIERRVAARAAREKEFLADPRLIAGVAAGSDRNVTMSVHAKTMRADTELTRYRYDVVLHVDRPATTIEARRIGWPDLPAADRLTALRDRLTAGDPVLIHGIPNRLLIPDSDATTAYELRQAVTDAHADAAVCLDSSDPFLLSVAAPSTVAGQPVARISPEQERHLAHEPIARYIGRRLPEVLRERLRRTERELAQVVIVAE